MATSNAFLQELLARVPAEQRAAAESALNTPEVLEYARQGALRQQEFSRGMDALRARNDELNTQQAQLNDIYTRQQAWWDANGLNADGTPKTPSTTSTLQTPPATPAAPAAPDLVRRAEIEKLLDQREAGAAGFFAALNDLSFDHFKTFGEKLDTQALIADAHRTGRPIGDVYRAAHAEKFAAKAKAEEDARVEARAQERVNELLRTRARQPFPQAGQDNVLDVLAKPADQRDASQYGVDAAVAEFETLVANRK